MKGQSFSDFEEFWPFYVGEHLNPVNRRLHVVGTLCFLALSLSRFWLGGVALAYAFAWTGHFFFEKNRPATFRHPVYSVRGDFRMFGYMLWGRMPREILRLSEAGLLARRAQPLG